MPALHVRDVPEPVMAALRERAAARNRSVQAEVREILEHAAAEPPVPVVVDPLNLVTTRTSSDTTWSRDEIYDDSAR